MIAYTALSNKLNIANCTNHVVNIMNPQFLSKDRYTSHYYLNNENDTEAVIIQSISQLKPLSIREMQTDPAMEQNGINFFQPASYYHYIDDLPNFFNYDAIIVSAKYADMAPFKIQHADFLDRLFTSRVVYNKYPKSRDAKIVGCTGLQKVCTPYTLMQYASMLGAGCLPSKISMSLAREVYTKLPNRYEIAHQGGESALHTVNNFLAQFGYSSIPTLFPITFNITENFQYG